MRSRTKKSEEVRTYFIQLESLISKYKNHMLDGMKSEIHTLEKQLKPKVHDSVGYIYVIKASQEKDSVYKIGRTKDLNQRLSTYATGRLEGLEVLFKYRTNDLVAVEACVKAWLKRYQMRKYKELYQANLDMIKKVISGCDGVGNVVETFRSRKAPTMNGGYYLYLSLAHD